MQTLRQLCPKLSARKQRQIAEVIEVIAGSQKRTAKA
jgi:toxic protein SymE